MRASFLKHKDRYNANEYVNKIEMAQGGSKFGLVEQQYGQRSDPG